MSPLASRRETLSMTKPPIAPNVHESLYVHRHFAAKVSLDLVLTVDDIPNANHLGFFELMDTRLEIDIGLCQDLLR